MLPELNESYLNNFFFKFKLQAICDKQSLKAIHAKLKDFWKEYYGTLKIIGTPSTFDSVYSYIRYESKLMPFIKENVIHVATFLRLCEYLKFSSDQNCWFSIITTQKDRKLSLKSSTKIALYFANEEEAPLVVNYLVNSDFFTNHFFIELDLLRILKEKSLLYNPNDKIVTIPRLVHLIKDTSSSFNISGKKHWKNPFLRSGGRCKSIQGFLNELGDFAKYFANSFVIPNFGNISSLDIDEYFYRISSKNKALKDEEERHFNDPYRFSNLGVAALVDLLNQPDRDLNVYQDDILFSSLSKALLKLDEVAYWLNSLINADKEDLYVAVLNGFLKPDYTEDYMPNVINTLRFMEKYYKFPAQNLIKTDVDADKMDIIKHVNNKIVPIFVKRHKQFVNKLHPTFLESFKSSISSKEPFYKFMLDNLNVFLVLFSLLSGNKVKDLCTRLAYEVINTTLVNPVVLGTPKDVLQLFIDKAGLRQVKFFGNLLDVTKTMLDNIDKEALITRLVDNDKVSLAGYNAHKTRLSKE